MMNEVIFQEPIITAPFPFLNRHQKSRAEILSSDICFWGGFAAEENMSLRVYTGVNASRTSGSLAHRAHLWMRRVRLGPAPRIRMQ